MQMVQNLSAEELAKLFYHYRDVLAPDFGCQGSDGSVTFEDIDPSQRNLMIAAATLVLHDLSAREHVLA